MSPSPHHFPHPIAQPKARYKVRLQSSPRMARANPRKDLGEPSLAPSWSPDAISNGDLKAQDLSRGGPAGLWGITWSILRGQGWLVMRQQGEQRERGKREGPAGGQRKVSWDGPASASPAPHPTLPQRLPHAVPCVVTVTAGGRAPVPGPLPPAWA